VDSAGNVIVSGSSKNSNGYYDYYTVKYAAADGTLLWEARSDGSGHLDDTVASMVIDHDDNVIVTGTSYGPTVGENQDFFTVKYSGANGAILWQARYNDHSQSIDYASFMVVDSSGDVIVTGSAGSGFLSGLQGSICTVKYRSIDGALLWKATYADRANITTSGRLIAVDSSGDVAVSGSIYSGSINSGYYTAKYSGGNGALRWERSYQGAGPNSDDPRGICMDSDGNVVVTGSSDLGGYFGIHTVKYRATDGATLWEKQKALAVRVVLPWTARAMSSSQAGPIPQSIHRSMEVSCGRGSRMILRSLVQLTPWRWMRRATSSSPAQESSSVRLSSPPLMAH
jgi:hypothetical protein